MVKSARKSETETFGIVRRFHRFEDFAGKRVYVPILNVQGKKTTWIWGKNGQKDTELTQSRQEQAWRMNIYRQK